MRSILGRFRTIPNKTNRISARQRITKNLLINAHTQNICFGNRGNLQEVRTDLAGVIHLFVLIYYVTRLERRSCWCFSACIGNGPQLARELEPDAVAGERARATYPPRARSLSLRAPDTHTHTHAHEQVQQQCTLDDGSPVYQTEDRQTHTG